MLAGRLALSRCDLIPVFFGHFEIDCVALDSCAAQGIECKVVVYLPIGASHQRAGDDSRNMCNNARVFLEAGLSVGSREGLTSGQSCRLAVADFAIFFVGA